MCGAMPVNVLVDGPNAAHARTQQAAYRIQYSGFARAVCADQRDYLTLIDVEGYILYGVYRAVVYVQDCLPSACVFPLLTDPDTRR